MYDRVATRLDAAPARQWKSTVLGELSTLLQFLRLVRALPPDQLWVFSFSLREDLAEQLEQENQRLASTAVPAPQFHCERMPSPKAGVWSTSEREGGMSREGGSIALISQPLVNERGGGGSALGSRGTSAIERR
jgi:hypothetical protein